MSGNCCYSHNPLEKETDSIWQGEDVIVRPHGDDLFVLSRHGFGDRPCRFKGHNAGVAAVYRIMGSRA